ncbi:hypothetical protein HG531_002087 [Fusarium graminearum]|nr:hypothetical protein HG531_002087 [Fusarium graminearum]
MSTNVCIDSTKDVIHSQDFSTRIDGSSQGDSPLLSTTQIDTIGTELSLVAIWKYLQVLRQSTNLDGTVVTFLNKGGLSNISDRPRKDPVAKGLEDSNTNKSDRWLKLAVDDGVDGKRCRGKKNGADDPASKKTSINNKEPPEGLEFPLSHSQDTLLPAAFKSGEFNLPHTEQSLIHHGKLFIAKLHQLV